MPATASTPRFADLLKQGGLYLAAFLLNVGESVLSVVRSIIGRFPGTSSAAANELIDLARKGNIPARDISKMPLDRPIPKGRHVPDPNLEPAFRYVVDVELIDPDTGESYFRTVVIDSDKRLSRSDILERLADLVADLIAMSVFTNPIPEKTAPYYRIAGIRLAIMRV